ncbi:MAG: class II fructose-bisphosphate aldolase [Actinomycetota bacterium]
MPLVPTSEIVAAAQAGGCGAGAFNVITLEHAEAIVSGAEAARRPAVLQISENAVAFHGGNVAPIVAACRLLAAAAAVPVALHLDHVTAPALARRAADEGFSSLMFDASHLPYEANVEATAAMASWAHDHHLWIEAELGEITGKDGVHAPGVRTDPDEACSFVSETAVDALAVAVGSSHAMTERTAELDVDLIARLHAALPVPLVLHGSSGVPDAALRAAVTAGIVKINIGTALNVAFTQVLRTRLRTDDRVVDPRTYLLAARAQMSAEVQRLLEVLHP